MSDELSIFGSNVAIADQEALVNAMEDTVDEGARGGDVSYMSFSGKRGLYKIGTSGRQPGEDEPFLVASPSFELGWICWKGGRPIGKRMANIQNKPVAQPDPDELGPFDDDKDGWSRARAVTMKSLDNGEQCLYSTNSKSCVSVLADMQREVLQQMRAGEPSWPVITLGMEEFTARGNTNYKITYDVVKWVSSEEVQALADPNIDPKAALLGDDTTEKPKASAKRRSL